MGVQLTPVPHTSGQGVLEAIVINIHHFKKKKKKDVPTPTPRLCALRSEASEKRKRDSSMQSISVSIDRLGAQQQEPTRQVRQTDGNSFK
jgi:hypothetical protein